MSIFTKIKNWWQELNAPLSHEEYHAFLHPREEPRIEPLFVPQEASTEEIAVQKTTLGNIDSSVSNEELVEAIKRVQVPASAPIVEEPVAAVPEEPKKPKVSRKPRNKTVKKKPVKKTKPRRR